jgi:hypothetical protein
MFSSFYYGFFCNYKIISREIEFFNIYTYVTPRRSRAFWVEHAGSSAGQTLLYAVTLKALHWGFASGRAYVGSWPLMWPWWVFSSPPSFLSLLLNKIQKFSFHLFFVYNLIIIFLLLFFLIFSELIFFFIVTPHHLISFNSYFKFSHHSFNFYFFLSFS